jgi:hypothetical protein
MKVVGKSIEMLGIYQRCSSLGSNEVFLNYIIDAERSLCGFMFASTFLGYEVLSRGFRI